MTILRQKPIHRSPWWRAPLVVTMTLAAFSAVVPAHATPSSGVMTEYIVGSSTSGIPVANLDIMTKWDTDPGRAKKFWMVRIDTKGPSELYVVRNTFQPQTPTQAGGSTGWHTHPGPSLISVTEGTITVYDGDDPSCTPHVYPAGTSVVDEGGGHVHLLKNEGSVPAVTVAVQLVPAGVMRRIDAPSPGNCQF